MLQTNEKDNKKIEYIALYCRVDSANSQANDLGIEAQKERLALWAKQQGFIWWTVAFPAALLTAPVFSNSFLVAGDMQS